MFLNTINYNAFGQLDDEDSAKEVWSPPKLTPKEIFLHFYRPEDDKRDMQQVIARKKRAEEEIEKERIQNRLRNQPQQIQSPDRMDISAESPMDISGESPIVAASQEQDALEICSWLILKKKNDLTENEVAFVHAKLDEYGVEYDEEEADPLVLCDALLDKFMDPKGTMRKDQKKNKIPIANQIYMKHQQRDFIKSKRAEIKREMNEKIRTLPGCNKTAEKFQSELFNMIVDDELAGSNIKLHQTLFEAVFPPEPIYKTPLIELKNGNNVVSYVRLNDFYDDQDEHVVQVSQEVYDNLVLTNPNGKTVEKVLMRVCDLLPRLTHISMVFFGTDQERLELESAIQDQIPEQLSKLASVQLGMEFPVIAKNGDTLSVMVVRLKGEIPIKEPTQAQIDQLFLDIENGSVENVRAYIDAGYSVNIGPDENDKESTPIFHAIETKNTEILQLLINAGADVNLGIGDNEFRPLDILVPSENNSAPLDPERMRMIELLTNAGALGDEYNDPILVTFRDWVDNLAFRKYSKIIDRIAAYDVWTAMNDADKKPYIDVIYDERAFFKEVLLVLEDAQNNPRPIIEPKLPEAEIFAGYIPIGEQSIPFEILKANPYLKDMYKLEDLNKVEVPKMTIWETLERMSPYTMLELRGKQEQVLTNEERDNMDYDQEQEAIRTRIDAGKANEEFSFFVTLIGLTLAKYRLFELLDKPGFYHAFIPTNQGIEQFLRDNDLEIENLPEKFLVTFVGSHITKDIDSISAYVKDVNSVKKKRKTADQEIMAQRQCRDVNTLNNTTAEICIINDDDSQLTYGGQRVTNFISCSNGGIHTLEYPFINNKRR